MTMTATDARGVADAPGVNPNMASSLSTSMMDAHSQHVQHGDSDIALHSEATFAHPSPASRSRPRPISPPHRLQPAASAPPPAISTNLLQPHHALRHGEVSSRTGSSTSSGSRQKSEPPRLQPSPPPQPQQLVSPRRQRLQGVSVGGGGAGGVGRRSPMMRARGPRGFMSSSGSLFRTGGPKQNLDVPQGTMGRSSLRASSDASGGRRGAQTQVRQSLSQSLTLAESVLRDGEPSERFDSYSIHQPRKPHSLI